MALAANSRKKQGFHHKDLRRALIEVTCEAIAKNGSSGLNIRELARELGVTHVAVYRHFEDKSALLQAAAESGFAQLQKMQSDARDKAGDDVYLGMLNMGLAYIEFAHKNKNLFSFMFSEANARANGDKSVARGTPTQVVEQIKLCQERGIFIEISPEVIFGVIVAAPHGFAAFDALGWDILGDIENVVPQAQVLLEITLQPFCTKPLSAHEIQQRYLPNQ